MTSTPPRQAIAFIQDELDTAKLYDTLAAGERDKRLADVYRRLASAERRHADHWIERLRATGVTIPQFRLSWRTLVLIWLARRFGASTVISVIANQEQADARKYANVVDKAAGMDADERGHARALRAIA